jgi:ATP-dependent Clp protease ATP-binding subunit ClpC
MYERFTDRARRVMQLAEREAKGLNHSYVGAEHLLLGMMAEGKGVAGHVLRNFGIDLEKARTQLWSWEPALPSDEAKTEELPLTTSANLVLEESLKECRKLDHNYVGTEHLLLGLCRQREGVAVQLLTSFGLKLEDIHQEVLNLLGHGE